MENLVTLIILVLIALCIIGIIHEQIKKRKKELVEDFKIKSKEHIENLVQQITTPHLLSLSKQDLEELIDEVQEIINKLASSKYKSKEFDSQKMLLIYSLSILQFCKTIIEAKERCNSEDIFSLPEGAELRCRLALPNPNKFFR